MTTGQCPAFLEKSMKKFLIALLIVLSNINLFAQDFPFPPELKWWISEIQSINTSVKIENFKFSEKRSILNQDGPISYKNCLYPVLKKWNYYGNEFAYYDIYASLEMNKSGKYSIYGEPESAFGIFDKNENLLFIDFFGSSKGIDSFCWVRDNRIIAVGRDIINSYEDGLSDIDFIIYDYYLKNGGEIIVKEYTYNIKSVNMAKIKLRWVEQRSDYFENN